MEPPKIEVFEVIDSQRRSLGFLESNEITLNFGRIICGQPGVVKCLVFKPSFGIEDITLRVGAEKNLDFHGAVAAMFKKSLLDTAKLSPLPKEGLKVKGKAGSAKVEGESEFVFVGISAKTAEAAGEHILKGEVEFLWPA